MIFFITHKAVHYRVITQSFTHKLLVTRDNIAEVKLRDSVLLFVSRPYGLVLPLHPVVQRLQPYG